MNKELIGIFSIVLVMGIALGATTGAFGEVASLNACHCLMFNSTNKINVWTLHSSFNTSLQFNIVKPNLTNITIMTSVLNGTIQPNSYYPINVTVVSKSPINQSGYILAYAVSNTVANSGGASIRLGTQKLLKISANSTVAGRVQSQAGNTSQTTKSTTSSIQTTAGSTTIQSTQNKNSSIQSAGGGAAALSVSVLIPYLIVAIVLLLVVICALSYHITRNKPGTKKPRKKKKLLRMRR